MPEGLMPPDNPSQTNPKVNKRRIFKERGETPLLLLPPSLNKGRGPGG